MNNVSDSRPMLLLTQYPVSGFPTVLRAVISLLPSLRDPPLIRTLSILKHIHHNVGPFPLKASCDLLYSGSHERNEEESKRVVGFRFEGVTSQPFP